MSALKRDITDKLQVVDAIPVTSATTTQTQATGTDMQNARRAFIVHQVGTLTGGGATWTPSVETADTVGGSYTGEVSADVFSGGAPAGVTATGINAWSLNVDRLSNRFLKVVLTASGTVTTSEQAASLIIEKKKY